MCSKTFLFTIGQTLPRKSTSEEVREYKPSPSPVTIVQQTATANHVPPPTVTTNQNAPRMPTHVTPATQMHSPIVAPAQKQVLTQPAPPQPAPRRLSQPNGQVRS